MADLKAGDGILEMTIQITRKETGKVEEYKITTIPETTIEDKKNGSNTHNNV